MSKTIKQLAKEALAVQDASNLCGVAQSFARAMIDLGEHTKGTDDRNQHPISVLWADKVAHLTGTQSFGNDVTMKAYSVVHDMANRATVETAKVPASSWDTPHLGIVLADDSECEG